MSPGENNEVDLFSYGADGLPGGEGQNQDLGNWRRGDD
jgi:general secretion pathway protein G